MSKTYRHEKEEVKIHKKVAERFIIKSEETWITRPDTYYHMSSKKFEVGTILMPQEPDWVSSQQSEQVVERYKKGLFVTNNIDMWYEQVAGNCNKANLYIYKVRPLDVEMVEECFIDSLLLDEPLIQWFIYGGVEIVKRSTSPKRAKYMKDRLFTKHEYEYYNQDYV